MLSKQLLFAATAAAFLVVPELSESDREVISTLPFPIDSSDSAADSIPDPYAYSSHAIGIPCQQCGADNALIEMEFVVEDGTRLLLNGFELYPSADPWHDDLKALVGAEGEGEVQTLGYGLFVKSEVYDPEQPWSVVPIDLQIVEVGGRFVTGLPKVTIKLLKAGSNDLIIGSLEVDYSVEPDAGRSHDNPLMRIKDKMEALWKKLNGGCPRHGHGGNKKHPGNDDLHMHMEEPENVSEDDLRMYHEALRHGARPFRHDFPHAHRHGHRRYGIVRLLRNIVSNILLPILAGITAGVAVAVLTMSLCSCFALVFRARDARVRRCRGVTRLSKAADSEPAIMEEKAGLMEAQNEDEAPPQCRDDQQAK